jgi:hypothetical protein
MLTGTADASVAQQAMRAAMPSAPRRRVEGVPMAGLLGSIMSFLLAARPGPRICGLYRAARL